MKKSIFVLVMVASIASCNSHKNIPDTSHITISATVERFDNDFFGIDTLKLDQDLQQLQQKYPALLGPYLQSIVGVEEPEGLRAFYRLYKPIYDSAQKIYKNFLGVHASIAAALKLAKYYFPAYETPQKIYPIIGPMNSREDLARMANGEYTPNFIGPGFIGISLQFYLGRNFSLYQDEFFVNTVVPQFRSARFAKEYIPADVMKLVVDDISPDNSKSKPLIEQMIERGKHWWLLDKFLPAAHDSLKTGYSGSQLTWCKQNEGLIWSYIVKNENLYSNDPFTIQTYLGEAPFTQGFSQELSPGNLGSWIGWQIVKKYADKKKELSPAAIMQVGAKEILEEAKYKPK